MLDDSRLREHARQAGWKFRWRTWRKGTHWYAEARAWKDGKPVGWFGTSTLDGEQVALDHVTMLLIRGHRQPQPYPLNLMDQRQQGKGGRT
ncbi:hypothetical protein M527_07135 [Sphingobium indicum IP26]|uniref:Uncharacterized protein n=1 Tax=Sphingobium indicum F2 TaxID=1450518 RepID=A0A8E0WSN4_9SPHN|nr:MULTISPECIES: hypothetical protein [Sphingobium]EPR09891.1 hypothetical protein M527_07135 [Sphingobium indicum IP26]EQB05019.1 hypothetical protein L286_09650 [Sphingobium sp. HDIP04]KER36686.1 hypothetical protein AL00_09435 [Sphingobium indicum F2]